MVGEGGGGGKASLNDFTYHILKPVFLKEASGGIEHSNVSKIENRGELEIILISNWHGAGARLGAYLKYLL